jgi:polyhydroxybutyrate depolymerase
MPCRPLALLLPLFLAGCSHESAVPDAGMPSMTPPSDAQLLYDRPYTPTIPTNYTASKRWPLLIVLAGYGGLGSDTSAYLGFTGLAIDNGIFLVTPDADAPHLRYAWNPNPNQYPDWDMQYLRAIIRDMKSKYAIDPGQVFVVGHSLGAHMAHRMACDDSPDVAAIMSLAGQVSKNPADCAPTSPVSVLQIHGTADQTIGYNGDVQNNPPDPSIPSAHETVAVWARNDHCSGAIADTGTRLDLDASLPGSETTVEAYAGCPPWSDADAGTMTPIGVELWSIQGGMHRPIVTSMFAPLTWGFLSAHARP